MKATILCYHKVGPKSEEGRALNIEPHRLRIHVRFFVRRSFRIFLAQDLNGPWPDRTVCFTFDDAYASTMENAPPILEEFGVRGSFYAVGSKIGKSSDWDGEKARPLASASVLVAASRRGHEIGNHSWSHPHLAGLGYAEQRDEIRRGHEALKGLGITPKSFCFPYGSLNDDSVGVLGKQGYSVGLALRKSRANPREDRRALSRIVVGFSDALPLLLYKIYVRPALRRRNRTT
jgi:peptidoglycan/xylan/chitin deacetylase (PgdA/CDA1 family)